MSLIISLLLLVLVADQRSQAADPDALQDFCIADLSSSTSINGFVCKDSKAASSSDFVSQNLRGIQQVTTTNGINFTLVTAGTFPGLNTLGLSIVRADLGPGGVVPLHLHPRSSELVYVVDGTIRAGFVDSNNKLFDQTLERGDMLVVPKGLLHFQWNVGTTPATILATLGSQNPGTQLVGFSLFTSSIPSHVLERSLQVNKTVVDSLVAAFS